MKKLPSTALTHLEWETLLGYLLMYSYIADITADIH